MMKTETKAVKMFVEAAILAGAISFFGSWGVAYLCDKFCLYEPKEQNIQILDMRDLEHKVDPNYTL